jgi:hypothetical protein
MPKGLIAFPGSEVTENLADKARRLGIRSGGSAALPSAALPC